jgi:tetratricopeptide (TPR) repeat protein
MTLFGRVRGAAACGKAIARFNQGAYADSAKLFEKGLRLDPDMERKEVVYSYLGQCYLALGRNEEAVGILSRAYEPYNRRSGTLTDDFQQREFLQLLNALSQALKRVGQVDRSQEITRQAEEYLRNLQRREASRDIG